MGGNSGGRGFDEFGGMSSVGVDGVAEIAELALDTDRPLALICLRGGGGGGFEIEAESFEVDGSKLFSEIENRCSGFSGRGFGLSILCRRLGGGAGRLFIDELLLIGACRSLTCVLWR